MLLAYRLVKLIESHSDGLARSLHNLGFLYQERREHEKERAETQRKEGRRRKVEKGPFLPLPLPFPPCAPLPLDHKRRKALQGLPFSDPYKH